MPSPDWILRQALSILRAWPQEKERFLRALQPTLWVFSFSDHVDGNVESYAFLSEEEALEVGARRAYMEPGGETRAQMQRFMDTGQWRDAIDAFNAAWDGDMIVTHPLAMVIE